MNKDKIRVQIIEDDVIVADDISKTLTEAGYNVCGIANDYLTAMNNFRAKIPNLIICDINLGKGRNGIDFVRESRKIKRVPVIFLTAYVDNKTVDAALNTTPDSYLTKPFTDKQLLISANRILNNQNKSLVETNELPAPTRRELEIIYFIAKGDSSKAIADKLCISFDTVQTHRKNIFNKFKISSSAELIALAHKNNWLTED